MALVAVFLILIFRRGRTTTGMVITMLYHRVLTPPVFDCESRSKSESSGGNKFLQGDYKLILQLSHLLEQGKKAKHLTDSCIDDCAHLQNLREAIYDHKLRLSLPALTPDQIHETEARGLHYLLRYFYLIVFSEYLLEELRSGRLDKPFLVWLGERREITNLTLKANLSFD